MTTQHIPSTAAEAAEAFRCEAFKCRLNGASCADRHARVAAAAQVKGKHTQGRTAAEQEPCAGCPAGAARVALLGVRPATHRPATRGPNALAIPFNLNGGAR